jgi:hypothetical protein
MRIFGRFAVGLRFARSRLSVILAWQMHGTRNFEQSPKHSDVLVCEFETSGRTVVKCIAGTIETSACEKVGRGKLVAG